MDKRKVTIFLAVCFGISFVSAGVFHWSGGRLNSLGGQLLASLYMFIPLVSVLLTQLITGERPFSDIGLSFRFNRWWLLGWLVVMPLFAFLSVPFSALVTGASLTADTELLRQSLDAFEAQGLPATPLAYLLITFLSALVAGITVNAVFAFGEEAAWRGFLYRCFGDMGFWKKSLLIGVIWGVWHFPLILMGHNYPDHPVAGVFFMIVFCTLLSPVMVFLRERSGSVVVPAVAHGMMNALAALPLLFVAGYNDLLCAPTGVAGFILLLIFDAAVYLLRKKQAI